MIYLRLLIISLVLTLSCKPVTIESNKQATDTVSEQIIKVNKFLIQKDVETVKAYANRRKWQLKQTESGLFYNIYKQTNNKLVQNGNTVTLKYNCQLLDGTVCYTSDSLGLKKVKIGKANIEAGLEEALLLMKKNEAAHLLLIPHLAYGLMGDNNKIPPRATLVYDIEIINIEMPMIDKHQP